jgi:hypothetical protein
LTVVVIDAGHITRREIQDRSGLRAGDVLRELNPGDGYEVCVLTKDRLGLDPLPADAAVAGRALFVQRCVPGALPIAVLSRVPGKPARSEGTVFRFPRATPITLDGDNANLKKEISEIIRRPVAALFALRKDGRTIVAGPCTTESTRAICVITDSDWRS